MLTNDFDIFAQKQKKKQWGGGLHKQDTGMVLVIVKFAMC